MNLRKIRSDTSAKIHDIIEAFDAAETEKQERRRNRNILIFFLFGCTNLPKKTKDKDTCKIIITTTDKCHADYRAYVLVKGKELPTNPFEESNFHYSYHLDQEGVEIEEIIEPKNKIPKQVFILALKKVCPEEKWRAYKITIRSKKNKEDIERIIEHWLEEEGYQVMTPWVFPIKDRITRKEIPIPDEVFTNAIAKLSKDENNTK